MHLHESIAFTSVEAFLTPKECADIAAQLDAHIRSLPDEVTSRTRRSTSVHTVPGLTRAEAMAVYEPEGRLEIDELPRAVVAMADAAGEKALPLLNRWFPTAQQVGEWFYVEYGAGEYVTPHVDCPDDPNDAERDQIAAVSVALNDSYEGGEFVLHTCGDAAMWLPERRDRVRPGADNSTDWFRKLETTCWRCRPAVGCALVFGSQMIHSTLPVTGGRVQKLIGFVLARRRG